ncbi:MAG: hypothetical protein RJA98_3819 [Pseudomonadota bacterium]|jgi:uncharacterized membrane protein YbhN (UPF0104 family)
MSSAVSARIPGPWRWAALIALLAATAYAAAMAILAPAALSSLPRLFSPTGALAAVLCLLSYALRGWRWQRWMHVLGRPLPAPQALRIYLSGYAFTATPGNVGEAARGLLLPGQPLTVSQSLAIYVAERVADLLGLLVLALPALWWLLRHVPLGLASETALIGAVVGVLLLALVAAVGWRQRAVLLRRWTGAAHSLACLRQAPGSWLALTLLAWCAQGVAVMALCQSQGLDLSWPLAMGGYAAAMVGGALSFLPAGLGGCEALLSTWLVAQGAPLALALALTVQIRLVTLWLAVAAGALSLLLNALLSRRSVNA